MSRRIVVVGGQMAGLRAAEQLRAAGWADELVVVGDEPHPPYNRPPLSKELLAAPPPGDLGDWHDKVAFRQRRSTADVVWRLGHRVAGADLAAGFVTLDDGETLSYDGLVAATGVSPRRLPFAEEADRRFAVRTLDDSYRLAAALRPGSRVLVVGAGFIGCEVAAALAPAGHRVTLVAPHETVMMRGLGAELGAAIEAHHRQAGIEILTNTTVSGPGDLGDADVVVEAIGSVANTGWLAGNGLDLTDGLLVDEHLRVPGHPDVVAVGDVARFANPRQDDVPRRIEHWCVPTDSARHGARALVANLTGGVPPADPFAPLVSFWSDQGDLRIQSFGTPFLHDDARITQGDPRSLTEGVVAEYRHGGRLTGVVLVNISPADHQLYRSLIDHSTHEGAQP